MKIAMIAGSLAVLALGGLGWLDTAAYRSTRQAYEAVAREHLPQWREQVLQDEARYKRCDPLRTENKASNTIDFTPEGRACLIEALQKTASVPGALVLVRNASVALSKNPEDQALRLAALGAVDQARRILARDRAFYDQQEQIKEAHTRSRVMRLLTEPPSESASFAGQAMLLDQAEYSIHLPRLYQSQQIWRLEALLPQKG